MISASNSNPRGDAGRRRPPSTGGGGGGPSGGPNVATPPRSGPVVGNDDDVSVTDSVARARAEVSVMGPAGPGTSAGGGEAGRVGPGGAAGEGRGPRARPLGAEMAAAAVQGGGGPEGGLMGDDAGAGAFEVVDEGGELVRVRFTEFLQHYSETINEYPDEYDEGMDVDGGGESHHQAMIERQIFPYLEQARHLAIRRVRKAKSSPGGGGIGSDDDYAMLLADDDAEEMEMTPFSSTVCVNHRHVRSYDPDLAEAIEGEYVRFEPYLRRAAREFVLENHPELDRLGGGAGGREGLAASSGFFVAMYNCETVLPVRALRTGTIGRFSAISGTVTRTSDVRPELLVGSFRCQKCGLVAPDVLQQYHLTRPPLCRNPRCQNRSPSEFRLEVADGSSSGPDGGAEGEGEGGPGGSEFVDWQRLRVQENADEIPPGSMPRTVDVVLRNEMVERAKAGDRVVLTGALVVVPDGSALARAGEAARASASAGEMRAGREAAQGGGGGVRGLSSLGVKELTYRTCFVACCVLPSDVAERVRRRGEDEMMDDGRGGGGGAHRATEAWLFNNADGNDRPRTTEEVGMEFSDEEKDEIRMMKATSDLYTKMAESIAPTTFGHTEVKRGILLMLLSGVHKTTSEGIRLRGDINVCIVGDPSTAKSQFLKFVHAFLPDRCVYTSGKAASAAGLTAAVVRDADSGEFCIEAGALMLADNGICCIDEFDKMDQHDQVAIHEAMEQQTISITKAGITATLNARASILAAANPIHGRYDRSKTLRANVQLSAPILSRFDLFFVVLDECDDVADYNVAKHIISVHRCDEAAVDPPFSQDQMLRYIRFARTLNPQLTEESRRHLIDCYRRLRQGDTMGRSRTAYRITVRQLESLIRLSEARARLNCDDYVRPAYVREAFRLLQKSIIHVESDDIPMDEFDEFDEFDEVPEDHHVDGDGGDGYAGEAEEARGRHEAAADAMEEDDEADETDEAAQRQQKPAKAKKGKKQKAKTQITFEEYQAITNAISTHLRSLESESEPTEGGDDGDEGSSSYMTWGQVVEWYLEQEEDRFQGDMEELRRRRKLVNLVIRKLVNKDRTLVVIGNAEAPELERKLAVHPNVPSAGEY